MINTAKLKRLMIFVAETDRFKDSQLASAVVERCKREGCHGATVIQGITGFGAHGQIHSTALLDLAINLPIVIMIIDDPELIDRVIPILEEMIFEGLIVVDEVDAIKITRTKK